MPAPLNSVSVSDTLLAVFVVLWLMFVTPPLARYALDLFPDGRPGLVTLVCCIIGAVPTLIFVIKLLLRRRKSPR